MPREERVIVSLKPKNEIETLLIEAEKKKYRARIRLYRALLENGELPLKLTSEKLGITAAMLKPLVEKEIVDLKTVKKNREQETDFQRPDPCCPESGTEERGGDRDPGL